MTHLLPTPSRRGLLVGTAVGVGTSLAVGKDAQAATSRPASSAQTFELRDVRVLAGDLARPAIGERALVSGNLLDADGRLVGALHADVSVLHPASRHEVPAAAALETHHLTLPEGTVVATGTADHLGNGIFAVTGGTGAYGAARGSYTLTTSRHGQGGDGTGSLVLRLR